MIFINAISDLGSLSFINFGVWSLKEMLFNNINLYSGQISKKSKFLKIIFSLQCIGLLDDSCVFFFYFMCEISRCTESMNKQSPLLRSELYINYINHLFFEL